MTRVTVIRNSPGLVTTRAPAHLYTPKGPLKRHLHGGYVSVTGIAVKTTHLHVAPVREVDVIRNNMNLSPIDRFPSGQMEGHLLVRRDFAPFSQCFFAFRFIGSHMAKTANFDIRNGRSRARFCTAVAINAGNLQVLDVSLMAVLDRLSVFGR